MNAWDGTMATFPRSRRLPRITAPALAQLADLATLGLAVSAMGIACEQNPVVSAAYGLGGMAGVALLKAGYMAVAAAVARWAGPCRAVTALWAVVTGGCAFGAATNIAALAGLSL